MNRPSGGGGTTMRPGNAPRQNPRPGAAAEREARATRTQAFLRGLVSEMKRVTWPSRQEWVSATILTIGLVFVIGLYTDVLDQVFAFAFGLIHK